VDGFAGHELLLPAREPETAEIPEKLNPQLRQSLGEHGIEDLYSHQARAVDLALDHKDLAVVTGTSSGKTLCYALPALQQCLEEPAARVLMLFPTKALAQDQLSRIESLSPGGKVRSAVYDGDTSKSRRSVIRNTADIILSNPDMLHVGILPYHETWRKFLRNLKLVVIDEAHVLRGAFGSHAGWVIRRLLRLAEWHGSRPQVMVCSATLPNAAEHGQNLTGRSLEVIDEDGAPQGEKRLFLIEAPGDLTTKRESPNSLTGRIMAETAVLGARSLAFCRSRTTTELVVRQARDKLESLGGSKDWVESYRGGYTPEERRDIEKRLFQEDLRGLASTSAMELGVDVGGLDVVVLNGYPGRLSSFWQQAGRCGRSGRFGAVVYIAHEDPLEHFLVQEPKALLQPKENAVIDLANAPISEAQIRCAAYERALARDELSEVGESALKSAEGLESAGDLQFSAGRWFFPSYDSPARSVNIRTSSTESFTLIHEDQPIGDMEEWRAHSSAHPGAVYLHRDRTYQVRRLDLEAKTTVLEQHNPGYWTRSHVRSVASPVLEIDKKRFGRLDVSFSSLTVTQQTTGYQKIDERTGQMLAEEELDLPVRTWQTVGIVIDFDPGLIPLDSVESLGALHALEHALVLPAPLLAGCDPRDIDSVWFAAAPETLAPRIVIFDVAPGGLGFSQALFAEFEELYKMARRLAEGCGCEFGCPRCLLSPRCPSKNEPLNKKELLSLFGQI
jgi:DEAD/DEAH box helicase domain-containing protein